MNIHQKTCAKLWVDRENRKPKRERRPLPQPPTETPIVSSGRNIDRHNEMVSQAFEQNVLKPCPHCARTFLEDRLQIHLRSCTADNPHKTVREATQRPQSMERHSSPIIQRATMEKPSDLNSYRETGRASTPSKLRTASEFVQCQYCTRHFDPKAAERHIPICKDIVNKPKPPPQSPICLLYTSPSPRDS